MCRGEKTETYFFVGGCGLWFLSSAFDSRGEFLSELGIVIGAAAVFLFAMLWLLLATLLVIFFL